LIASRVSASDNPSRHALALQRGPVVIHAGLQLGPKRGLRGGIVDVTVCVALFHVLDRGPGPGRRARQRGHRLAGTRHIRHQSRKTIQSRHIGGYQFDLWQHFHHAICLDGQQFKLPPTPAFRPVIPGPGHG
jgi:hypothetical protein